VSTTKGGERRERRSPPCERLLVDSPSSIDMSVQMDRVEVSGGGEDGDVESGEEIGAVGRVVGDGDPMGVSELDDEGMEVR